MPTIDDFLQEFPSPTRARLKKSWQALPAAVQKELQDWLSVLPGSPALWRMLVGMALSQARLAFGDKRTIAIVGPANVGKSTLYNQFVRSRADQAAVSPVPGTTRVNQAADAGLFTLVDTPGADAVGEVGETEKAHALAAARAADFLIVVFDAIQGVKRTEQELFHELAALDKPYLVVLNKIDLVKRQAESVIERAAANLDLAPEQILALSAKDGQDIDRLLIAIAKTEPEIVAALGQALPEFRWRLAWTAITGAASTSAAIALTPLPILDVIPLLAVQASLVLGIARIYNYKITLQRAREISATFGVGILGRTLFQELSKFGGPPGWVLSAAIAASTTVAMGFAAIVWFERGERLTNESLRRVMKLATDTMLDALRGLGRRRPNRQSLKQRVAETLEASRLAADRQILEEQAEAESRPAGEGPQPDPPPAAPE